VRFFLDHDVAVTVRSALISAGHECWTAAEAGLNEVTDDTLTVYAARKHSVLVTHDPEFSQRRRRAVTGWHLQLRCTEWEAATLLLAHLDEVAELFARFDDVFIVLSPAGLEMSHRWS
jgi:predicted nuclease of predicted toxin-antitoxin system